MKSKLFGHEWMNEWILNYGIIIIIIIIIICIWLKYITN
jgi:hypothetical protein